MVGPSIASQIHTHVLNAVTLVWGSLRPAPIMHRPEEALDIQSELIFVNVMVHVPHE